MKKRFFYFSFQFIGDSSGFGYSLLVTNGMPSLKIIIEYIKEDEVLKGKEINITIISWQEMGESDYLSFSSQSKIPEVNQ